MEIRVEFFFLCYGCKKIHYFNDKTIGIADTVSHRPGAAAVGMNRIRGVNPGKSLLMRWRRAIIKIKIVLILEIPIE